MKAGVTKMEGTLSPMLVLGGKPAQRSPENF